MKGGDLSDRPTYRYLVSCDAVFQRIEDSVPRMPWQRWFHIKRGQMIPDPVALSELWNFSARLGVRLELFFVGDDCRSAPDLWEELSRTTNPFNDWHAVESMETIISQIPFRPDILGYVDIPSRTALFGGKGLTVNNLR